MLKALPIIHKNGACQINRINKINTTNRINNGLIDLCKLGSGLIQINMD